MANTRFSTGKHNHDDDASLSSSRKRINTFDNYGVPPWSDLNNDVLFLVMMKLGVVDFLSFSKVCKSWRSFAFSNKNTFMASSLPVSICVGRYPNYNQVSDCYAKVEDVEGRRFKTVIPHSAGRIFFGVTCGYLILFKRETCDFLLVNLITGHELHFPDYHVYVRKDEESIRAILVFSASLGWWVLVVFRAHSRTLSFCIAGKRRWNHLSFSFSIFPVFDLHAFKGKIYTLHTDFSLRELRLNLKQKCKSTSLEIKNISKQGDWVLISSGENLYMVLDSFSLDIHVLELDFDEMKWVSPEKILRENAFFLSCKKSSAAIKLESWPGPLPLYEGLNYSSDTDKNQQPMWYYAPMWYFPHECLNANLLDE